jgi:uncharacterized protein with PCYCGC motif
MGRKSSAKSQQRESSTSGQGGTPSPSRSTSGAIIGAIAAAAIAVGGFAYVRSGAAPEPAASAPTQTPAAPVEPAAAKFGPHTQANLPPLPVQTFAPPRPPDVVRAAYVFAAEHPEILSYVPCFCGCERGGHRGNDDCFVAARNEKGDVTQWEPHGLDCAVCIDVATEARRMHASGANVRDIRAAIEKKWAGFQGGHTPTPTPPSSH